MINMRGVENKGGATFRQSPRLKNGSRVRETVRRSLRGRKVSGGKPVQLNASLVSKLSEMAAIDKRSEKRGTKRVGTSVDDALVAAEHVGIEINWKSVGTFGCYHCPHAFSKIKECVFVFCLKCHEEKTKKVAEKRSGQETNNGTAAVKRRGGRGRAAAGVKEVNVCDNLKK